LTQVDFKLSQEIDIKYLGRARMLISKLDLAISLANTLAKSKLFLLTITNKRILSKKNIIEKKFKNKKINRQIILIFEISNIIFFFIYKL